MRIPARRGTCSSLNIAILDSGTSWSWPRSGEVRGTSGAGSAPGKVTAGDKHGSVGRIAELPDRIGKDRNDALHCLLIIPVAIQ